MVTYTKLPEQFKNQWVEALRSGNYEQGRVYLYNKSYSGPATYCCLGVACSILGQKIPSDHFILGSSNPFFKYRSEFGLIPAELADDSITQIQLSKFNDRGATFNQIADWIENNL